MRALPESVRTTRLEPRRLPLLARASHLLNWPGRSPPVQASEDESDQAHPCADSLPGEASLSPREQAREHIRERSWGRAQRILEDLVRRDPDGPAPQDLTSLRAIRRSLRRIAHWPSDVDAHLNLARAYFDLDLGEEALQEFLLVQRLAPERYEAFVLAAVEYLYRGEYTRAMSTWIRAQKLKPELPDIDEVLAGLPRM